MFTCGDVNLPVGLVPLLALSVFEEKAKRTPEIQLKQPLVEVVSVPDLLILYAFHYLACDPYACNLKIFG